MTWREVLLAGEQQLERAGVLEAELNAWYLFADSFDVTRSRFFLCAGETAGEREYARFQEKIEKRCRRIPLEYITGKTEFMGLPFKVCRDVLVPRQDTECLVEEALLFSGGADVLDLCTGSGCIGISLAKLGHCSHVTLSDKSAKALFVAEENARMNEVSVQIVESDLFTDLDGIFDLIVSNPPYIPKKEIPGLMPEVSAYEPVEALDGGEDGLAFYREITEASCFHLRDGGRLLFEIGSDQGSAVRELMQDAGFSGVEVKQDLSGLDRICIGQYKK